MASSFPGLLLCLLEACSVSGLLKRRVELQQPRLQGNLCMRSPALNLPGGKLQLLEFPLAPVIGRGFVVGLAPFWVVFARTEYFG